MGYNNNYYCILKAWKSEFPTTKNTQLNKGQAG